MAGEPLLLRRCKLVLACADCKVLQGASIYVEDGSIVYIGERVPSGAAAGRIIECSDLIAIPCLYSGHSHVAMVAVRGVFEGLSLREWLERVWAIERKLTPHHVYEASRAAALELAANGVCGVVDMYFYPEATARAFEEAGLRLAAGPVAMGEELDPYTVVDEARRFIKLYSGSRLVRPLVNVHSVYATPVEVIRELASLSSEENVPLHIHVAETRWEVEYSLKRYGLPPVGLLKNIGALTPRTIMAHAGWISSSELAEAGRVGATLVHCPASNMKLGSNGRFPLVEAKATGARVALGTDGPATNNSLDMFLEMKLAALLQGYVRQSPSLWFSEVFQAASEAVVQAIGVRAGRIEVGLEADIVLLNARRPWFAVGKPLASIVFSATGADVAYTIVAGRLVYSGERSTYLSQAYRIVSELARQLMVEAVEPSPKPPCSPPRACRGGNRWSIPGG
jgi:cytosine/adenosine deaminase-related metal-dependent hydrolase